MLKKEGKHPFPGHMKHHAVPKHPPLPGFAPMPRSSHGFKESFLAWPLVLPAHKPVNALSQT